MLFWTALAWAGSTVAVADLSNHTGDPRLDAAGPGTASILVTRLAAVPELTLVERTRLDAVLAELELSQGGAVDDASRVEAGRLLGAEYMVLGALVSLEPGSLTVNVRVIDTATAQIVGTEEVMGQLDSEGAGLLVLVDQLADAVVHSLPGDLERVDAMPVESVRVRELQALLRYGAIGEGARPAGTANALWRDRSKDMLSDAERRRFAVFTEGGARVPDAGTFARLVGDAERVSAFDSTATGPEARRARRGARRMIGWVYSPDEVDRWIEAYNASLLGSEDGP